jgi:type IX secretion system PorP/SprF family membrane protein
MNKLLVLFAGLLSATTVFGQQLPLSENYFIDTYSLSSAYAGYGTDKFVFASYRRDWAGLKEGPRTLRLSYNGRLALNTGLGAKLIVDKIGIFQSFFAIGTYSYKVKLSEESDLRFGLSAGVQQNSINFSEYYNDPGFATDPSMVSKDVKSKLNLVNDLAALYSGSRFQAGVLLSNMGLSDYKYSEVDVSYTTFMTYQLHSSYAFTIQEQWTLTPMIIYRIGSKIKNQTEFASRVMFKDKFWGTAALRGQNIFSLGFGMDIGRGFLFNYTYNLSTSVTVNAFQNHEFTLGLRLNDIFGVKKGAEGTEGLK